MATVSNCSSSKCSHWPSLYTTPLVNPMCHLQAHIPPSPSQGTWKINVSAAFLLPFLSVYIVPLSARGARSLMILSSNVPLRNSCHRMYPYAGAGISVATPRLGKSFRAPLRNCPLLVQNRGFLFWAKHEPKSDNSTILLLSR